MTAETRVSLEPKDILRIEIECQSCKYRCSRAIDNFYGTTIACPNCNASWLPLREEFDRLAKLAHSINLLATRQDTSIAVRFEITDPRRKEKE